MSIKEMMVAQREKSLNDVREMLWTGSSMSDVAAAAVRGGLDPDEVEKMAAKLAEGLAMVERLREVDLAALENDLAARKTASEQAYAALQSAETVFEEARAAASAAENAMALAKSEFERCASEVAGGVFPADGIPDVVMKIVESREAYAEFEKCASSAKQLRAEIENNTRHQIAHREELLARMKDDPGRKDDFTVTMRPLIEQHKGAIRDMKKQIKDGENQIKKLEAQSAAARQRWAEIKLPW